ncbi:MAG: sulfite reductase [Simkania negevensis]|nr:sulfite reductase [Simkania negevensis]
MFKYSKDFPFPATIAERTLLSQEGSTKKTYHISLDLKGSGFSYRPGDTLAIFPENPPEVVELVLACTNSSPFSSLRKTLETKVNLSRLPLSLLRLTLAIETDYDKKQELAKLLEGDNKETLSFYLKQHSLFSFLKRHSHLSYPLEKLLSTLPPLLPRFYSISSSQKTTEEQADLLVATFTYFHGSQEIPGLSSSFLCERAKVGETIVPTYIHRTKNFILPSDPHIPILMIGPGTGVAPYRAFLQERMQSDMSGKNWLFFGERNSSYDFYYKEFFEKLKQEQKLELDLAFSRDQNEKVYVQHKLYEKRKKVWQWLEEGAYLYVCGDAKRMAKDVHEMLQKIAVEEGGIPPEKAKSYLLHLKREGRYLVDVY